MKRGKLKRKKFVEPITPNGNILKYFFITLTALIVVFVIVALGVSFYKENNSNIGVNENNGELAVVAPASSPTATPTYTPIPSPTSTPQPKDECKIDSDCLKKVCYNRYCRSINGVMKCVWFPMTSGSSDESYCDNFHPGGVLGPGRCNGDGLCVPKAVCYNDNDCPDKTISKYCNNLDYISEVMEKYNSGICINKEKANAYCGFSDTIKTRTIKNCDRTWALGNPPLAVHYSCKTCMIFSLIGPKCAPDASKEGVACYTSPPNFNDPIPGTYYGWKCDANGVCKSSNPTPTPSNTP
jgi:hypothetical protein